MPESAPMPTPPTELPPAGSIVDTEIPEAKFEAKFFETTGVQELRLGATSPETENKGGSYELDLDAEPLTSAEDGFKIGGLDADLLAIVEPGDKPENGGAFNVFGIARIEGGVVGSENAVDYALVLLKEGPDSKYHVADNRTTHNPAAHVLKVGESSVMGRNTSENMGSVDYLKNDISMSSTHMEVALTADRGIVINDLNSKNGTQLSVADKVVDPPEAAAEVSSFREQLRAERASGISGFASVPLEAAGVQVEPVPESDSGERPDGVLIDEVPSDEPGDADRVRSSMAERQNAEEIGRLEAVLEAADAEYQALIAELGNDVSNVFWRAASAKLRQASAERDSNFAQAGAERDVNFAAEREIGSMQPEVAARYDHYKALFGQMNSYNYQLWALRNPGMNPGANPYR